MSKHPSMSDRDSLELARRDFEKHLKDGLNNTQMDMVLKLAEEYMNKVDLLREEIKEEKAQSQRYAHIIISERLIHGMDINELKAAQKIEFPRQMEGRGGWKIDYNFIEQVQKEVEHQFSHDISSFEQIEAVLLAIENLATGEGGKNE